MEITPGYRSHTRSNHRTKSFGTRPRQAFRTDKPNHYAFLSETIDEIACSKFFAESLGLGGIDWDRNLPYLEASAKRWCELHEVEYSVKDVNETPLEKVQRIYQFLISQTHDEHFDVDYIPEERMIKFIEYHDCDFPSYRVFYFPVKYINEYEGKMREALVAFASWIYKSTLFLMPEDCYDFEMILESYDYYDAGPDEEDDEENDYRKESVAIYRKGDGFELFNEIKSSHTDVIKVLDSMSDEEKKQNARLIELIRQGMALMNDDDLRGHTYFPGYCSDSRFVSTFDNTSGEFVLPERLFVFCYGDAEGRADKDGKWDEDEIASAALQCLSEEANNGELLTFRDGKHITPYDDEIFVASEYPMKWAQWFNDFLIWYTNEQAESEAVGCDETEDSDNSLQVRKVG